MSNELILHHYATSPFSEKVRLILGFKGLERRAVVLVVNEESAFERSRERLYVGLSRARDQLVVCGDPDFIRAVGGPDLARRLNLAPH